MALYPQLPVSHDAMLKALLDEPGYLMALAQDYLPPDIAKQIDPNVPPQQLDGSFVDPKLRSSQTDRLYELTFKGGGTACLYLLVEHKSQPDGRIFEQLLRYQARIMEKHGDQGAAARRAYPPVFPLVIYHGKGRWNVPCSLAEVTVGGGAVQPYGAAFRYHLLDISHIPYDKLSRRQPGLWAGFAAMRVAFRPDEAAARLTEILRHLPEGSGIEIRVVGYMLSRLNITQETMRQALTEVKPNTGAKTMGTLAESLMAEGKADMLVRLLQRQFGPLPQAILDRVGQASLEDLDAWAERIFDAPSLDAIFASSKAS